MKIDMLQPDLVSNSVTTGAMRRVDVIDSAGGNVGSVCRALERLECDIRLVNELNVPSGDVPVILPGVGAFGRVMENLMVSGMDNRIRELIAGGVPFLGICVGLQVLFESSEESPGVSGLAILPGTVVRLTNGKIPQIGWNSITSRDDNWSSGYAYFVNSYVVKPSQPDMVLYESNYFQKICVAVKSDNLTGFQFHPEKSGNFGMSLLSKWLDQSVARVRGEAA